MKRHTRHPLRTWTLVATLAAAPCAVRAELRIDDWSVSSAAMDVLVRAAQTQDANASYQAVADAVVQDHVLAGYAQRQFGNERLFAGVRVGFTLEANADAALTATLERVFQPELAQAIGAAGPGRFVLRRHELDAAFLQAALGGGVRLDDRLSAQAEAALARVVVLDYRLGDATRSVSVRDVWRQLDVQGRQSVLRGNTEFVHHQALRIVRAAFVRHWAVSHGLSPADIDTLTQLMADRERRLALEETLGVGGHLHGPSSELSRLKAEVTAADVARHHAEHPELFQRIDRVLARHIRCADEASAEAAYDELSRGVPFAQVAHKYSTAPSALKGGALGWIEADRARGQWLAQVAFAQAPGAASRPIRESEGRGRAAGWQIVQVEQRVQGLHPADSETVRFIATEAIAKERARQHYAALKDQLLSSARIRSE